MPANTNQTARFAVSSSIVSMFDENSNQLRLAGYDAGMQIAIWEPEISPDGKMTFPEAKRHTVILSQEAIATLDHIIRNEVAEKIASGQSYKKGIPTNRASTNIIDIIVDNGSAYLRMSKELDADKKAKGTYLYKFAKDPVVVNYNPQSGEFDVEMVDAQFALFSSTVSMYTAAGVYGHGAKYQMNFNMNRIHQILQAIATKLGVTINPGYNGGNSSSTGAASQQPQYNGPMTEASDISALLS